MATGSAQRPRETHQGAGAWGVMEFDFRQKWPYFLKASKNHGVADMWLEDCAAECAIRVLQAQEGSPFPIVVVRAIQDFKREFGRWRRFQDDGKSRYAERPYVHSLEQMAEYPHSNEVLETHARDNVTPERAYCCKESLKEVDALPERERRMLLMYAMGWRFHELGAMEGIGESRACQIVKQARQNLRETRA
ncbi:MAG: hypothetical protein EHM35_05125, partial [Planctomycetaceae bacterium]